jgi:DNA replication and repair protein RecF
VYLRHLQLGSFRNWDRVDLALRPGPTVFVGRNGEGKTNLVEAVGYLATMGSHRVAGDAPLVRQGASQAVVRAALRREDRELLVEIEINPGRANRVRVNRAPLPRPRELLGLVKSVLFAPEDLALVRGDPAERRRFLDDLLVSRTPGWPACAATTTGCSSSATPCSRPRGWPAARRSATLDVWDGHLTDLGGPAAGRPAAAGRRPAPHVAAPTPRWPGRRRAVAALGYAAPCPRPGDGAPLVAGTRAARRRELPPRCASGSPSGAATRSTAGVTLVGPHRDDLVIHLGVDAGQGVRQPRGVLVAGPGAQAGLLRAAARGRGRADPRAGRRLRHPGRRPSRGPGDRGPLRGAVAGHRGRARRRPGGAAQHGGAGGRRAGGTTRGSSAEEDAEDGSLREEVR